MSHFRLLVFGTYCPLFGLAAPRSVLCARWLLPCSVPLRLSSAAPSLVPSTLCTVYVAFFRFLTVSVILDTRSSSSFLHTPALWYVACALATSAPLFSRLTVRALFLFLPLTPFVACLRPFLPLSTTLDRGYLHRWSGLKRRPACRLSRDARRSATQLARRFPPLSLCYLLAALCPLAFRGTWIPTFVAIWSS